MGGGTKKKYENQIRSNMATQSAERAKQAASFEEETANRIGQGRAFVEPSLYTNEGFSGITDLSGRGRDTAERLANDVSYSGAGREGYQNLADTGGFTPESE